jgi:hypothetical protein
MTGGRGQVYASDRKKIKYIFVEGGQNIAKTSMTTFKHICQQSVEWRLESDCVECIRWSLLRLKPRDKFVHLSKVPHHPFHNTHVQKLSTQI